MQTITKISLGFVVVLGMAVTGCQSENGADQDAKKVSFLPMVELEQAQVTTFEHKIDVQGNIESDQVVMVNAEIGGQISKVLVKEGQRVQKGQTLIQLDAEMTRTNLEELQAQLDYAKYMLGKQQQLKDRNIGSEMDYETAKNQVKTLEARRRSMSTQLGKMGIVAPFSGVIDKVMSKVGEVVAPGVPLIRVVNNSEVYLSADVSEKHYTAIKVGTPLEVRFPNYMDTSIMMKVSTVGNYIDPNNRTFSIRADMKRNDFLLPNMLAEVRITDKISKDALVVPSSAIIKDQDNKDFLFVASDLGEGKYVVDRAEVKLLSKYNGLAEVENQSGKIKKDTWVVTSGARGITPKDTVRIK